MPSILLPAIVAMVSLALLTPSSVSADTVYIGNGSGYLGYPTAQTTLGLEPGDTLYINAGTYSGISLSNLAGTAANPITVQCDPDTVFTTATSITNNFSNIAHINFEDFRYETYLGRAMLISGDSHDLLFRDFNFENFSNYCFLIFDSNKVFDGTKASTFYNFTWDGCVFDGKTNGAAITNAGDGTISNLVSVLLDFKIIDCTFAHWDNNTQTFGVINAEKCFNLEMYGCDFSDLGMLEPEGYTGHTACINGSGYYKVHHNTFTRHWANDMRVIPLKLNALGYNGADAVNRYYNNLSYEKVKYPPYLHRLVDQSIIDNSSGYLSRTSSEVYFNTMYRSRMVDYVGQLVSVYGPNITIKHNLIIEPEVDGTWDPQRDYVVDYGSGPQDNVVVENNLVFQTLALSGLTDAVDFVPSLTSAAKDAATGTVSYITDDLYCNDRYVGFGDVGAVENQTPTNAAPIVDAGDDALITLPTDTVSLDATVVDDDLPSPPSVTTTWTKQSGPGSVTFGNASAVDTTAEFSTDGEYVLRLTASDGSLNGYDELTVTVEPAGIVWNGLEIITPEVGTAIGSPKYPYITNVFNDQPTWDAVNEEPAGEHLDGSDNGLSNATASGYMDFGPDWADLRITQTWTRYRAFASSETHSPANFTLWWDDDIDTTNDGTTETTLKFGQMVFESNIGYVWPWYQDVDVTDTPTTPAARYLLVTIPDPAPSSKLNEFAFVGYVNPEVEVITPVEVGTAIGSPKYPYITNVFNDQPTWDAVNEEPTGEHLDGSDNGLSNATASGYIDFGPGWASLRITQTWTRYRAFASSETHSPANFTMWWDDDIDTTNDGTTETTLKFGQMEFTSNIGYVWPWYKDVETTIDPVTPQGRYLLITIPDPAPSTKLNEFAFIGYIAAD